MLLPAAEEFLAVSGGNDKELKEVKSLLSNGVEEEALLSALSWSPQIAKESQEQFAGLMANAAGDVEVFAMACQKGRREGEGFTQGVERGSLLHEGRGKEEGESESFADRRSPLRGALIDGVEQPQGRFIRFVPSQEWREELCLFRPAEDSTGNPVAKEVLEFFPYPCRCGRGDERGTVQNSFIGGRVDGEVEASREFEGAQHPDWIFLVTDEGVANDSQSTFFEVVQPTDIIDNGKGVDIVEEGIDCKVPPEGVLFWGAKDIFAKVMVVGRVFGEVVSLSVPAEGGDFDDFGPEANMGEPKAATDKKTVAEEFFDLPGGGIGCNVEIFRGSSQKKVADAATDEVSLVILTAQAIKNFQGLFVELFAGNMVFGAGEDEGQVGHNRVAP